jgi:putative ABC transport system permease protein
MRPPLLASWVLRLAARRDDRPFLLGDLRDEFNAVAAAYGRRAAARWYWRQVLASMGPLIAARIPEPPRAALLAHHTRHSLRVLAASPGATATAVLTLALGIGANTAVFSVVDAVLLRPLPYHDPDRLVSIWQTRTADGTTRTSVSPADFVEYGRRQQSFDGLAAHTRTTRVIGGGVTPEEIDASVVTWNLFDVIGSHPSLGRAFVESDAKAGAQPTVILSDAFWRTRCGADPSVLGRSLVLSGRAHLVVGVMPEGFAPPTVYPTSRTPALFVPAEEILDLDAARGDHEYEAIGRLRPGVSIAQARGDLRRIDEDLARRYPGTNGAIRAAAAPLAADMTRGVRLALLVVLGAVGLIVLIASLNVANLLIVRAVGRRQEVAIRLALGASRADIVAESVTRGIVLAALGGLLGLAFGSWTRDLLVSAAPAAMPRLDVLSLNPRIFAATAGLALLTGIIAGLVPALQIARAESARGLKVAESASSGSRSVRRWQGLLMACEIAAAIFIAVGAGLLVRSLARLYAVDLGFQTERVLTFSLRPSQPAYADPAARLVFFEDAIARLERIRGVRAVAFASDMPLVGGWGGGLLIDGASGPVRADADLQAVSATYFSALGIPLVRGRLLTAADRAGAPAVVVVSQAFATRLLPGRDPLGVQIRRNAGAPALTIVGIVGDIRRDGKFSDVVPQVFFSAYQTGLYSAPLQEIAVRSASGDPRTLLPAIQRAIGSVDAALPLMRVRTLDEILSASMAARRFNMLLLTSFAALALVLALIGVYGVVAHAAAQRTREIGIRVALGAGRRAVESLIVRDALRWTLPGLAAGAAAAWSSSRVMASMLFNVTPTDPFTFVSVGVMMLLVSVFASYLPARRAATIDPLVALRRE